MSSSIVGEFLMDCVLTSLLCLPRAGNSAVLLRGAADSAPAHARNLLWAGLHVDMQDRWVNCVKSIPQA
jgi:hypothetical protein